MLFAPIPTAKDSPVEEITRLPSGFASKRTQANENYSTGEAGNWRFIQAQDQGGGQVLLPDFAAPCTHKPRLTVAARVGLPRME